MRKMCLALVALGMLASSPANAALFVSGDVNIFTEADTDAPNRQFLLNLAGDGIVVLHPGEFSISTTVPTSFALGDSAVPHFALAFDAPVTAADLLGASLYLSYGNPTGWTEAEAQLLKTFMAGGGHVLLAGDNGASVAQNAAINLLSVALGSDLAIINDGIDDYPGAIANILTVNAFTAGTDGLRYISTSRVTGGTPLYGTADGSIPFLGFDNLAAVPEPSTWAVMILGFGCVGGAMRRRRSVALAPC